MLEILEANPNGLRYRDLIKELSNKLPHIPVNTIHGSVWYIKKDIERGKIKDITQPDRGVYILTKYLGIKQPIAKDQRKELKEEDFYHPFAEYLVNELEECTKAIPLGGNLFGDKWGTPDVIGVYKFSEADPIKPPIEIVSAEIKLDVNQLVTAFGQACSYKLFSHKVYLAVPKNSPDVGRIEALCLRFGLGFILFNPEDAENPAFEIRARAIKSEPDYYYVNNYIKRLKEEHIKKLL